MAELRIITSTTRPGRKSPVIASWIAEKARGYVPFNVEILDLAKIDLPMMNEPNHPRLRKYQHVHTQKWSQMVDTSDAFIFIIAEYNHGFTAPLKNAIDYLSQEWAYKPVGLVSYGGVAGGTRSVHMLKEILTALKMVPLSEGVSIPFIQNFINEDDEFVANEIIDQSADVMLTELLRWTDTLQSMRENEMVE
ncbi:MAG TPA: NADPH-dependent FMN reductase [Balneolales bacterium]|nr:NADPH-dependent FMN reductase [Balneolales bacterium]